MAAPGPVTRKIELTRQIEEMTLLLGEQRGALAERARRRQIPQGLADERLERQQAILKTLEFCRDHEAAFRAWRAERRQG